jgi:hypothetical protein
LREECRLRVFKNRVLRRIFGPKRDEVTGEWRKLHKKELRAVYSSPNIIQVIQLRREMGRVCNTYGERRGVYRRNQKEGRPLERLRRKWLDNIKIDLQ